MKKLLGLTLVASLAAAQGNVGNYPTAQPLTGTERILAQQGGINTVNITPPQIQTYICNNLPGLCTGGGGGGGGVNSVAVATANGFGGTVATPTTTPVITIDTTVNGILQGNGTALSAATTSGTGAVVLANSAVMGQPLQLDCTNCTNLQSADLIGTIPTALIPGSSVRYAAASTCTISSTDNGNVVNFSYGGATQACTIPDIDTNGIAPNAFQMATLSGAVGETLMSQTTTTLINGQSTLPMGPSVGSIWFADANNSAYGQYNYNVLLTGESAANEPMYIFHDYSQSGTNISDWGMGTITGTNGQFCLQTLKDGGYEAGFASGGVTVFCATRGASGTAIGVGVTNITLGSSSSNTTYTFPGSTATFSGNVKPQGLVLAQGGATFQGGQAGLAEPANYQVGFYTPPSPSAAPLLAGLFDGNQNLEVNQGLISQFVSGISLYPVVSVTCASGCTFPTDDTGTALAGVIVTSSSPTITNTGTNGLYYGESVYLSGTIPTGFTVNTPYYVTNVNSVLTSTSFQLSAASGTSGAAITPTSGTTGNATVVTIISGIYKHSGGAMVGWFTLPTSATYGTGVYVMTLTYTNYSSPNNPDGYRCDGSDELDSALLVQTAHGLKTATLSKLTAATSGAVMGYSCMGTGGP